MLCTTHSMLVTTLAMLPPLTLPRISPLPGPIASNPWGRYVNNAPGGFAAQQQAPTYVNTNSNDRPSATQHAPTYINTVLLRASLLPEPIQSGV